MDCKAVETTHNIHSALGPGTPNEGTGQQWFRKFCKGDKSLEGEEHSGWPSELTMTNWKESLKLSSYNDTRGWQRTQCWPSMVVRHLKQIGKVKKLDISVPHDLTENKKNLSFWSIVFSYSIRSNEPFLNWIVRYMWRKLDFIQLAMSSSMLDLEAAPKHFPKPNLHQKRSWSLLDGLLLVWSTPTFWIPVKPLHLRSMLSKSVRRSANWNACSQHWSTERG